MGRLQFHQGQARGRGRHLPAGPRPAPHVKRGAPGAGATGKRPLVRLGLWLAASLHRLPGPVGSPLLQRHQGAVRGRHGGADQRAPQRRAVPTLLAPRPRIPLVVQEVRRHLGAIPASSESLQPTERVLLFLRLWRCPTDANRRLAVARAANVRTRGAVLMRRLGPLPFLPFLPSLPLLLLLPLLSACELTEVTVAPGHRIVVVQSVISRTEPSQFVIVEYSQTGEATGFGFTRIPPG